MRTVAAAILILTGLAIGGCGDGAKEKYQEVSQTSEFQTAQKAWHVFNFATNVANPLYYAEQGAQMGYQKYKENKESKESAAPAQESSGTVSQ